MPFNEALLGPEEIEAETLGFDESLLGPPEEDSSTSKSTRLRAELSSVRNEVGPLTNFFARPESIIPKLLLSPEDPGSIENILRLLPLGAGDNEELKEQRVTGISSSARAMEEGIRSAGHTENLPLLPLALVPGVAPAMGFLFGGQALGAGAGEASVGIQQGDSEMSGRGIGTALLGAGISVPAVRGKSFLPKRFGGGLPAPTIPEQALAIEQASQALEAKPDVPFVPEGIKPSATGIGTETTTSADLATFEAKLEAEAAGLDASLRAGTREKGPVIEPEVQKPTEPAKEPWQMRKSEGDAYLDKQMINAVKTDKGRIIAKNVEHGDMIPALEEGGSTFKNPNARGWSLIGRKPSESYIGIADLEPAFGDFHKAWVIKALREGKDVPAEVLADYPDLKQKEPAKPEVVSAPDAAPPDKPFIGMGAMKEGEVTPSPSTPTSIRNATVDQERVSRGLPPAQQTARRAFGTVWDEAMAALDRDPGMTDRMIAELEKKPRSLTDLEDALILHRQVDLQNEFGKATRDLARAYEDGQVEVAAAEQVRVNLLGDQLRNLYDTGKRAGTETARGLAARKMFVNEDFTLASMTLSKRAANEGRPLTPKETSEISRLHDQIADLQRQLDEALASAESKSAKETKPSNPALDPFVLKTRRSLELARAKWHEGLTRDRFDQLTTREKVFHHAAQTYDAFRTIITSYEFSAVLRQGKFILMGHPIRASRSLGPMFSALNKANNYRLAQELSNRPNASRYRDSGLYIAEHGSPLTRLEEGYMSSLADKIPGVAASQRAYTTFLNQLRADSFDAMSASLSRHKKATPAEDAAISNFINAATGRGSLGSLEGAAVGLNRLFFSPRYVASRFQLLLGQPLYKGTARTRTLIATEYARTLAGYVSFYTLAHLALPDSEVETDPRSSDAGKIKIGNTRLDPLAGLQQSTVLMARLGTGEITSIRGRTKDNRDESNTILRFLRSKLAPVPGAALNVAGTLRNAYMEKEPFEDVVGNPVTPGSIAQNLLIPIAYQDILNAMEDQGIPRGTALGILSIFGEGLQVYDEQRR